MRRRTFVVLAGITLSTAVAGCLADGSDAADPTPEPTETGTPNGTGSPGGAAGESRLSDDALRTVLAGLPEIRVRDYPTVTYTPDADPAPAVYFAPEAVTIAAPTTATFTLHNGSDATVGLNPSRHAIYRLSEPEEPDGTPEWEHLGPEAYAEPWLELNAGRDLVYSFAVGDPDGTTRCVATPCELPDNATAVDVTSVDATAADTAATDGTEATTTTEVAEPSRHIAYDPEGGIEPGIHALCVFASVGGGELTTFAAPFVLTTKGSLATQ